MDDPRALPVWPAALKYRKYQKSLGVVSGLLLAAAMLSLFDGLLANARASGARDLVRGSSLAISGPAALKNPVASDLAARFSPPDSGLEFRLEGFFAGYWFGGGMWRGEVAAPEDADPGRYVLSVSFKGASAPSQKYALNVFASAGDMRAASLSLARRGLDQNPFALAAALGLLGVAFGGATWLYGRRYLDILASLGMAPAYAGGAPDIYWRYVSRARAAPPGSAAALYDEEGNFLCAARALDWRKGRLEFKTDRPLEIGGELLVRSK